MVDKPTPFQIFVNEQAAELEVVRAILQSFVVRILSSHPRRAELFESLRTDALKRLSNEISLSGADQDAARKAQFVHLRATKIFDEMAPVFDLGSTDQPKQSN
jgi:hypothetical protein